MCGFSEQYKGDPGGPPPYGPPRSSFVTPPVAGGDGSYAIRLHTETTDTDVHGSGTFERDDLQLAGSDQYCNPGQEEWWADSILFPDDYVAPPGNNEGGVLIDWHDVSNGGLPNLGLEVYANGLLIRGNNGPRPTDPVPNVQQFITGPVQHNVWYDFVFHVKWTTDSTGFIEVYLNHSLVISKQNIQTLYTETHQCYFKLAHYHTPTSPPVATSVLHDRVRRGKHQIDVW